MEQEQRQFRDLWGPQGPYQEDPQQEDREAQQRALNRLLRQRKEQAQELLSNEAYREVVDGAMLNMIAEYAEELEDVRELTLEKIAVTKGRLDAIRVLRRSIIELAEIEIEDEEEEGNDG